MIAEQAITVFQQLCATLLQRSITVLFCQKSLQYL